jgi:hypothetical protein
LATEEESPKPGTRSNIMKKVFKFFIFFPVLVFALAGPSYGWQGRMAGMAEPFGLLSDESDFLIHPSKIDQWKGITFYADYRFTYTEVMDWDNHFNLDIFTPFGIFTGASLRFNTSGEEYKHNTLLGAAFPLGPGRMGAFFSFENNMGDYDGKLKEVFMTIPFPSDKYSMDSELKDFSFSLIYGLPITILDFGLQMGITYRDEEKKWRIQDTKNDIWLADQNLHFFMNPYDSSYWEMFGKAGFGAKFNAVSFDWTVRGEYIIDSDNENKYEYAYGNNDENVAMKGEVEGWRIGSDFWLRYGLADGWTLPFLLSADYSKKVRDGHGIGVGIFDIGDRYHYKHYEKTQEIKVGGGVEKKMNANGLIGAGLYYHYLRKQEHQCFNKKDWPYFFDYIYFPFHKEHRLEMRVASELEISPTETLRMGLNPFYVWVENHDFKQVDIDDITDKIHLDGYTWGINASLGGTVKMSHFILEPFINGGYRRLNLEGDGEKTNFIFPILWDMDQNRDEWLIGGGFSIRF